MPFILSQEAYNTTSNTATVVELKEWKSMPRNGNGKEHSSDIAVRRAEQRSLLFFSHSFGNQHGKAFSAFQCSGSGWVITLYFKWV